MSEHTHVDGIYPFPAVMQTERSKPTVHPSRCGSAVIARQWLCCTAPAQTGDMWGHLASALIEDHMVVVPDLRGLGRSSKPDSGYDKKNQATDVMGVLDTLGVRTAQLVTHGIGIMVGFAVAATHPERVRRCVAIAAPLPGVGRWDQIVQDPVMRHFGFGGPDMERLAAGRERIYLDGSGARFPETRSGLMKRSAGIMRGTMRNPAQCEAGFGQVLAFNQDAATTGRPLRRASFRCRSWLLVAKLRSAL
jgi:pimeloyl-ACP methyl ester carboxylesterase